MHEADIYGHLCIGTTPLDDEMLSTLIGVPLKQVRLSLKELKKWGVFSFTDEGTIYSRRMVRDEERSRRSRLNGKKGGNPSLKNQSLSGSWVNPEDNPEVKAQKPEARYQSPESIVSSLRSETNAVFEENPKSKLPVKKRKRNYSQAFEQFWSAWREVGGGGDKAPAFEGFLKLDEQDRQQASDLARPWFLNWRQNHPDASPIHASTYLNKRRFDGFEPGRVVPFRPTSANSSKMCNTERVFAAFDSPEIQEFKRAFDNRQHS